MKEIKGYDGMYSVTPTGEVWSHKRKRFLKAFPVGAGYLQIGLCKDGKKTNHYIHRLVAEAYLDNPDGLPQVNHKDENKLNNAVENLEWCDSLYNNNYGTKKEKQMKPVYCEELNQVFNSSEEAAIVLNVSQSNISKCCRGEYKSCLGYHLKYVEKRAS